LKHSAFCILHPADDAQRSSRTHVKWFTLATMRSEAISDSYTQDTRETKRELFKCQRDYSCVMYVRASAMQMQ